MHTHRNTHKTSVYLVTNLNWSCYFCSVGLPPVSFPSSSSIFQILQPHLLSSKHILRVSFLAELNWPFSLCLSVGDPQFSSSMTSQHGLSLFSPSLASLSSLSSSPLSVLLQLAFVLLYIKWEGQRVGTCSSGCCWVEALIRQKAKKGRWQTVRAHPWQP